jgi:hypothetical protein
MIYPTKPKPRFFGAEDGKLSAGWAPWWFEQALQAAGEANDAPASQELIAFELFSASRFQYSPECKCFCIQIVELSFFTTTWFQRFECRSTRAVQGRAR